jgi:hypothetical protein
MYGDKVQIRDINGQIEVDERLEDVYDNNIYTIIDKQSLGESIGRELLDEDPDKDYMDNCHIIYEEIDKTINGIVNDIFDYVEEYLDNNQ